jgi:hypothetical protein
MCSAPQSWVQHRCNVPGVPPPAALGPNSTVKSSDRAAISRTPVARAVLKGRHDECRIERSDPRIRFGCCLRVFSVWAAVQIPAYPTVRQASDYVARGPVHRGSGLLLGVRPPAAAAAQPGQDPRRLWPVWRHTVRAGRAPTSLASSGHPTSGRDVDGDCWLEVTSVRPRGRFVATARSGQRGSPRSAARASTPRPHPLSPQHRAFHRRPLFRDSPR